MDKTQMVDKSNFDIEQYKADLQSAYDCGYVKGQVDILEKIRAEIDTARFIDKDTKLCKNANASGLEVAMQIIDKYKAESELKGENNG